MLATDSPSIVQQRVIVVVFFAVIAALSWWQNTSGNSDHPVQKFSQTPLPADFDDLDFTMAEAAWSDLKIDSLGNLKIDASTESALLDAVALMHDRASDAPTMRMAVLLEKQFGATASRQIMALLPILKNYKEAEQHWWRENGSKNPPPHVELFRLQDEWLGETLAEKMFAEQRRLMNVMLTSHQIRNDASLTQIEKDQALMNLPKTPEGGG